MKLPKQIFDNGYQDNMSSQVNMGGEIRSFGGKDEGGNMVLVSSPYSYCIYSSLLCVWGGCVPTSDTATIKEAHTFIGHQGTRTISVHHVSLCVVYVFHLYLLQCVGLRRISR